MSSITHHIAKLLRDVYFGGNWTWSNFKSHLAETTWQEANTKIDSLNTIVGLVYHSTFYVRAVTKVLEGGVLDSKDRDSFTHPAITDEEGWKNFLDGIWHDVEHFARLIEQLPEEKLWETFVEEKYGSYYRNLHGIIEHAHYHLGQIVIIKKMIGKEHLTLKA